MVFAWPLVNRKAMFTPEKIEEKKRVIPVTVVLEKTEKKRDIPVTVVPEKTEKKKKLLKKTSA